METKRSWGGRRKGAGRQTSGPFGEPTRTVRVPVSLAPHISEIIPYARALRAGQLGLPSVDASATKTPLFSHKVAAGFPSPADDHIEAQLDLNDYLLRHKESCFFLRVKGDSMAGANIHDGNLIIVERAIEPKHGDIVVAVVHGELTVKRLYKRRGVLKLQSANSAYPDIEIKPDNELAIWGAVRHVVHSF